MQKKRIACTILVLSLIPILSFLSCQKKENSDDVLHGVIVPNTVIFENHVYQYKGEIVATERIPDTMSYLGKAYLDDSKIRPSENQSSENVEFEVFAISGIDIIDAIAVKRFFVGKSGSAYYYLKYERK